jgi:hypothetical protein
MIGGVSGALVIAVLLLLLLLLAARHGMSAARQLPFRSDLALLEDGAEGVPCSPEFVSRIFSPDDLEFVLATKSPDLVRLFRIERKGVALLWVQQTSAAIQKTMREHKRVARESADLEFVTELRLVFLYAQLMLICGVLSVAIQSAGPLWLRGLAIYADTRLQCLARIQQSFQAATTPRELPRIGAA